MAQPKISLKLVSKPLTLAVDGHSINITDRDICDILFFQANPQPNDIVEAVGVSSIRMNLEQLKEFLDVVTKVIDEHESKKAKRK